MFLQREDLIQQRRLYRWNKTAKNQPLLIQLVSLIQLQLLIRNCMGCGAVCGNNTSVLQPNQYSQKTVFRLIPLLNHKKYFVSEQQFNKFTRQVMQNPLKYRLKVSNSLVPKEQIEPSILCKWKVLLYCFDTSNSQYNNCLGRKARKVALQNQAAQLIGEEEERHQFSLSEQSAIYPHEQFGQIQKDIDRTCDLPEDKKRSLQKVLKRISNKFPQMGYTQGINFIVAYLLIIGYSQFDTFWMFVHIAINRRYLLLGLFEDSFPLSDIYKVVFKNILRRQDSQLYHHLYQQLAIDQSMWVFKWFFTYFIYSFPHQMVKYVFDIVIQIGGIGLITFAIAITEQISAQLMSHDDVCDVSLFFQSLKDIHVFNKYVSINKLVERAYTLQITKQDFDGINTAKNNFYAQYILANIQNTPRQKQQTSLSKVQLTNLQVQEQRRVAFTDETNQNKFADNLIKKWYGKLTDQRQKFCLNHINEASQNINKKQGIPTLNQPILKTRQQEQIKAPEEQQKSVNFDRKPTQDLESLKENTVPSKGSLFNKKSSRIKTGDQVSQIDEMWQEQDITSCVSRSTTRRTSLPRTQNGLVNPVKINQYADELDKFVSAHNNPLSKRGICNTKISSIYTIQKQNLLKPKVNNYQIQPNENKGNKFAQAGQSILKNLSIAQNSQCGSQTSQYSKHSQKYKKSKQNVIYNKNSVKHKVRKNLYDQNQEQININGEIKCYNDQNSSSRDSYVDPRNSICLSVQSIQEQIRNNQLQAGSMEGFQSRGQRIKTQQDILIKSVQYSGIRQNKSKYAVDWNASQIQILQGPQVFKKKKRVSGGISGGERGTAGEGFKIVKVWNSGKKILVQKGQNSMNKIKINVQKMSNYQQSYESIMVPSQGNKSKATYCLQELSKCQFESVK